MIATDEIEFGKTKAEGEATCVIDSRKWKLSACVSGAKTAQSESMHNSHPPL